MDLLEIMWQAGGGLPHLSRLWGPPPPCKQALSLVLKVSVFRPQSLFYIHYKEGYNTNVTKLIVLQPKGPKCNFFVLQVQWFS